MDHNKPDLVVAVDFGTTFTGVAWRTAHRPIQVINDWPGSGDRGERKVPTVLVYNADGSLSSWGFSCADDDEPSKIRREFFKIFLDDDTLVAAREQGLSNAPQSQTEVKKFIIDYLRQVYAHIKETIETQIGKRQLGGWTYLSVAFLFSVPTTWTSMGVINTFKTLIREAGFGTEGPQHLAEVDLTEAEAASVATLKTSSFTLRSGSIFLTMDAGGGTTDLALMRVISSDTESPQMSQVAAVRGIGIGSALIDRGFVQLVSQRLAAYPEVQNSLPKDCALRMSRSHHFKTVKHKFGEKVYMQKVFKVQMEGVSFEFNHSGLRIESGRMLFDRDEIQALFDTQVSGIMIRIKEQLDWMIETGLAEQVEYLVLAGGLGSSAYLRDCVQDHLESYHHPNARNVILIPCQEPQLVVVRGLLYEQQQKSSPDAAGVLKTRIARASYGVKIRELYSPLIHSDEDVVEDRFLPNVAWAINQIQWIIRKGDTIDPSKPLQKSFEITLGPDDTTRSWDASFLISHNDASQLPKSLKEKGVSQLCSVTSNLTGVEQHELVLKKKRGTCFNKGYKYYICQFDVRVIMAPADIRFELWFGGRKFSGNHEPIAVSWD